MMDTGLCNHKKGVVSQAWMQELADGFSSYKNPYELQHFANFGLQRIIDFSMFLKTLMVDKRMESKVIAKSSAALTLLQRHYQHGEQLRDVHYQEFCSFDPYQQLQTWSQKLAKLNNHTVLKMKIIEIEDYVRFWEELDSSLQSLEAFQAILHPLYVISRDSLAHLREHMGVPPVHFISPGVLSQ